MNRQLSVDAGDAEREVDLNADSSRLVKWIVGIIVMGLASVTFTAWRTAAVRSDYERRLCEQIVARRWDDRDMWIWLGEKFPESAIEIGLSEQLRKRIPPLTCVDNVPTPITPEEEEEE